MEELHEYLDQWRVSRAWTVQRLADEVGVSQSLVSKWLHPDPRRRVTPSRPNLEKLAGLTGASVGTLRRMARPPDEDEAGDGQAGLPPRLAAFLRQIETGWLALDEAGRDIAERGARALFTVPPARRQTSAEEHQPGEFGRHMAEAGYHTRRVWPKKPSRAVATMRDEFGYLPA